MEFEDLKVGKLLRYNVETDDMNFRDCQVGNIYRISDINNEYDHIVFIDDTGEQVGMTLRFAREHFELITFSHDEKVPPFDGIETGEQFEQLMDYALDTRDRELFDSILEEMEKRGMSYVGQA